MERFNWWRPGSVSGAGLFLLPLGQLYDLGGRLRRRMTTPARAGVPVICIGNVVLGGAGKTPVVMMVADRLSAMGKRVHILTRGHGGKLTGPVRVEERHDAGLVGDEPMLLSRHAPTWVSRDRAAGARAAVQDGAGVIVMDDGFQNPGLWKDLSVLVVDDRGFGNGRIFPAGPLRESVSAAWARADAVVAMGDRAAASARAAGASAAGAAAGETLPILRGRLRPRNTLPTGRVVSFTGIGWPAKFHDMLRTAGIEIAASLDFPDHHPFTDRDAETLLAQAERLDAGLVTTEKDAVRLESAPTGTARARLLERLQVVAVDVETPDDAMLENLLATAVP